MDEFRPLFTGCPEFSHAAACLDPTLTPGPCAAPTRIVGERYNSTAKTDDRD